MTWTATGSFLFSDSSALTMSNQGTGDLLMVEVLNYSNNTVQCTGLTGGGATWTAVGSPFNGVSNTWSASLFSGVVTATGAATTTPTWSGAAPGGYEINGHEFISSAGSWTADTTGTIDSAGGTANWASLTPAQNGELYFGFAGSSSSVAGSTPGYVYNVNSDGDATAYNLSCPAGIATFPVWGNTNELLGVMALIQEGATVTSGPPYAANFVQRVATVPFRAGPAN